MLHPYTMEVLNAERLKDLDREAVGLYYRNRARRARRQTFRAMIARLGNFLIATGGVIKQWADQT